MFNLPPELIQFILEQLDLNDLIKFRLVSKNFKEIISKIKVNELYLKGKWTSLRKKNWFHCNEQIRNEFQLENEKQIEILLNTTIINLNYLEKLMIDFYFPSIDLLNKFTNLKHLELFSSSDKHDVLKLENLECFKIDFIDSGKNLTLQSSKLKILSCNNLERFNFNRMELIEFYESTIFNTKIFELKNLIELRIDGIVDNKILENLTKLKIIHFIASKHLGDFFKATIETIRILLDQSKQSKIDLKIYFRNNLITNAEQLDKFEDKPIEMPELCLFNFQK